MSGEIAIGDSLTSYGPALLSFNTYFNSFYEDYWIKHTAVSEIVLAVSGEGRFWCNVYREAVSVGCVPIGRYLIELGPRDAGEVRLPIALTPQGHGHGGRIFVDLEALTAATLTGLAWTTTQKPLREVAIGVGVCTFNREPFVVRTLQRLLAAPPEAAVARIVVVNQGARLESDAFAAVMRQGGGRLAAFEQGNFGGAGGFTRSAIELLKLGDVTHVLFMDDDIELDERHLITTAAFLRYARKPLIVGGHMLDLFRRNVLYEAGNAVSPDNQLRPNHHNLDLNKLESLTALSRAAPSHFNGWWYAAIPARCFREHGLPMPVFIRGDDMEYGTRLHRAGVETVALPPVSVWHEPFYAKAPGWQLYYDLRNRLIFAGLNDDWFSLESPSRLLKLLMVHLIKYDYQHAWLMMTAVADFLNGPALLDEGLAAIHARVTAGSAALAPARLPAALGLDVIETEVPDRPWPIRRRMLASLARTLLGRPRRGAHGVRHADVPLQWGRLGPSYVLTNRDGHFHLKYAYSRASTWRLVGEATRTIGRYRAQRAQAAAAWKAAAPRLTSEESWRAMLGLGEARATTARAA